MRMPKHMKMLVTLAVAGLVATAGPVRAATYDIIVGAGHPNTQTFVKLLETVFIPEVNKGMEAAGRGDKINWTTAFAGTVVKFESLLEGAQSGLVDIVVSPNVIRPSELPLNMFTYMAPFGSNNVKDTVEIVRSVYGKFPAVKDQWARFGQQPIAHYVYSSHNILSTFPIRKFEDVKGQKIGAAGVVGNFYTGSGATAVNGNFTTFYNDIRNGVYNGATGPAAGMYQAKLHEVAKHLNIVDFGTQYVVALTMNTKKMESLPAYVQDIVRKAALKYEEELSTLEETETAAAIEAMKAAGVQVHVLPQEERAKWANALPDLAGGWVKRLEDQGRPGRQLLVFYMDELRKRGVKPGRDWDAPFR
ncbi:MAG: TRAP transporter substrate-binding protein DctP [Pseudolabrys sp.]|nr:TRAP transporter substrate-binding protein DctP [Pseudolabrys sp.]